MKKRTCVFTGARSEYGLLQPLMERIKQDRGLELVLVVSGMHLSPKFGLTCRQIEEDGFNIDEKIENILSSDSPTGVGKSMGLGLIGYSEALERLKPEVVILLGDRYETFSMAVAAVLQNIPIAHIHGGELTYGAWDDMFRHSITKMSLLHFTCAGEYERRVIQLGEAPGRVFNVGSLGVDNIRKKTLLLKKELYKFLDFNNEDVFLLITFHPATLEGKKNEIYFQSLLEAVSDKQFKRLKLVFTKSNSDSFGMKINSKIDQYVKDNPQRSIAFDAMGQVNYLSAMKHALAMVGNSSSGIIEAPCFEIPVINIGSRQKGRIRAKNVIDCCPDKNEIIKAIKKGLSCSFKNTLVNMGNPFQKDSTALRIKDIIKNYDFAGPVMKEFFDIPQPLKDSE
ncbi:MAG: UDP-N-acetylglucosamine 2-epimerase (hydrolyzing) [Deltaproteobacteria bacterium]|nr:UDP-N-acetylglucosamine 2-epimerase (hydrolyzing) [Deltaproteobacteria bacterium]